MHELMIIQDVFKKVESIAREHRARKVIRLVLEVGGLSHHTPNQLRDVFKTFREISPLLQETEIEFRESADSEEEVFLRDIELEVPEDEDG